MAHLAGSNPMVAHDVGSKDLTTSAKRSFSSTSFCGISIVVTEKIMGKNSSGSFTLLFLIASTIAEAQQTGKVFRIGY